MNALRLLVPTALAALCGSAAQACDGLVASAGWIRQPPPNASHAAGYVTLANEGPQAVVLSGVSSPDFEGAMLHETRYSDGRAQMRHVDTLTIAPGERMQARPGGLHVMLVRPRVTLAADALVEVDFLCATGAPLATWLVVRRDAPAPAAD
ncbi:MAG: copper chaperone PCu(A)C [Gammaproteobacteria bacterium]